MKSANPTASNSRSFFVANGLVSVVALSFLTWLLLFREAQSGSAPNLRFLPPLNAVLNTISAVLLVAGRFAISQRRKKLHRNLMVSAFLTSCLFLAGYIAYHAVHGDTKFGGEGGLRVIYLSILASHILLSVAIVPLALAAFWFAWNQEFQRHTRVTRWLHPIWLYVSVTGVVVFLMLRPYYPSV